MKKKYGKALKIEICFKSREERIPIPLVILLQVDKEFPNIFVFGDGRPPSEVVMLEKFNPFPILEQCFTKSKLFYDHQADALSMSRRHRKLI